MNTLNHVQCCLFIVFSSLLFTASCSSQPKTQIVDTAASVPDDGWLMAKPSQAGLNQSMLDDLVSNIGKNETFPNVHALLIEHQGKLVLEHYWPGEDLSLTGYLGLVEHGPATLHDIRSITKSIISLLMGIALGDDAQDAIAQPFISFLPEYKALENTLDEITLHHVLTMTSGLEWNELTVPFSSKNNDFNRLITSNDPVDFVLSRDIHDTPGSLWNYNSGSTLLLATIIENETGTTLTDYVDDVLFGPLGISHYEWLTPPAWGTDSIPDAGAGLRMRARDLAKIGSVILHNGKWGKHQIVPRAWVKHSTQRYVQSRWGPYSYQWYDKTHKSGYRVITAKGAGDQQIYVLPQAGLAITIFAGNYDEGGIGVGDQILDEIIKAIH